MGIIDKNLGVTAAKVLVEAGKRTLDGNGQDFVENTIDVVFEPFEKAASVIDNFFGW
jgi:hypothetical protein